MKILIKNYNDALAIIHVAKTYLEGDQLRAGATKTVMLWLRHMMWSTTWNPWCSYHQWDIVEIFSQILMILFVAVAW